MTGFHSRTIAPPRLCAWTGRPSTAPTVQRASGPGLYDPDRVTEIPALPRGLQHRALGADLGQRPVAAGADRQELPVPRGRPVLVAVLDREGEGWGGRAITKYAATHGQSLDARRGYGEPKGDTKAD